MRAQRVLAVLFFSAFAGVASAADPVVWLLSRGGTAELSAWPASCTTYAGPGTLNLPGERTVHLKLEAVVVCPKAQVGETYALSDLDGDGLVDARPLGETVVAHAGSSDPE
jgi:hypothetical protein